MTDITARKEAETALKESEENFRHLFDEAPDAYIIVGTQDGRILACNQATERMLRGSREQIIGRAPGALSPPFQPDGTRSIDMTSVKIRELLETGFVRFEWMHRRFDGSDFWVEVVLTLGTFRQRQVVFASWREIGEIIAAKQAAEAASTAKSQFLSVMSHELRTPLTAIMGMFQLIGMAGSPEKAQEYVRRGLSSSEHLLKIVEDILDFSSIESGRLTVVRLPFRLATLLDEVSNVAAAMRKADVVFRVDADAVLRSPDLLGDALRLKQVLINLVGNALKFTDRGSVVLSVARAGGPDDAPVLEFTVADTGIGLAPGQQSRLFQPFTQVDMSNARRFGGTGLGLVISQRLVGLMGGEPIVVESAPGAGSRFSFRLPLPLASSVPALQADPDAVSAAMPGGRLSGLRVLVVEDSATVRFALRLLLQSEGATVEEAEDGAEAVRMALSAGKPFDALLMDMQMPVLDGLAATREMRARGYVRPIVALTANAFVRDMQECLAAGMNDYIVKPVKLNELVEVLRRNCRSLVHNA
jgi:PAS domain S-box-containing protein